MKILGCGLGAAARAAEGSSEGIDRCRVRVAGRRSRIHPGVGVGAIGVLALSLAACGGGSSPSSTQSSNPPPTQFTVGGSVTGLSGTGLVLQDNGGDNLPVSASGPFTFATKLNSGAAYSVTVMTQPSGQNCAVASGSGTVSANVTNVAVSCTNTSSNVTIGGTVTGLTGTGLVLQDNGGDNLTVTQNGAFTFATALASGAAYAVTVSTQPSSPAQTCTVTNGSGTASTANVTSVAITCAGGTASVGKFAYTANYGDGTISAYTIDPGTGALTAVAGGPVADGTHPAAVSLAPNGKFAFSASDNGTKIQAYTIDQTTGALTPVGTVSTGFSVGSAYPDIAVDPQSAHLYIASAGDNEVAGFAIDPTMGTLTPVPNSPIGAGAGAGGIPAFSPDGKYLYVMNQTANTVSGYSIDSTSGALTPLASGAVATGATPDWIVFTPDGKFAYVANSGEDSISAYSVSAGVLTPFAAPNTSFPTDEHPQQLTIDAGGTHLYAPVANGSTAGAVDWFTINADGTLANRGTIPAGVTPVYLDIDPAAPFAYVASKGGAEVYGYSIDATTGALTALSGSPFSTG
ncbi:MAG: beta-propeller fold lactonase family protein, partial [Gammaproteobacteria bacterium]|nr:beta-propeller fold lactonase family protein [Gammaproteobacteria bacterium]